MSYASSSFVYQKQDVWYYPKYNIILNEILAKINKIKTHSKLQKA